MSALLSLCLLLALSQSSQAAESNADTLWQHATFAMAQEQHQKAFTQLEALLAQFPQNPIADDALYLAATLLEEKLARPKDALRYYQKLTKNYPQSRAALAATRHIAMLKKELGDNPKDEETYRAFQKILQEFPSHPSAQSIAWAQALLSRAPPALRHRIAFWLASTHQRQGNSAQAVLYYEQIANDADAPPQTQYKAHLGASDAALALGNFHKAQQHIKVLELLPLPEATRHALHEIRMRLTKQQRRRHQLWASYLLFALMQSFLLTRLRQATTSWKAWAHALHTPALEFWYMLPLAFLLFLMALSGHRDVAPAVAIMCTGSLLTTLFMSAVLRASTPLRVLPTLLCMAASLLATASACFIALYRSNLLDLVFRTIRLGPQ